MEKIIFKKITSIFFSVCILIFILFSINIFYTAGNSAIDHLDDMILQIEGLYNKSKEDIKNTKELFKEDYLNRAYAVEFIISNTHETMLNNELLSRIKALMEVSSIHVIDYSGEIKFSSDSESIGLNLMNYNKSEKFWDLINSDDKSEYVIELDGKSIVQNKDKIYVGVKSNTEKYSVIQISLDKDILESYLYNSYITTTVKNTPTVYERAIFIVNKENGNIDAITQNNETEVNLKNINTKKEFLQKLYDCRNGKLVKVNNKFRYLKTKSVDNYIIAAYVDVDFVYKSLIKEIIYLTICLIIILICILVICKFAIKKYVLEDLYSIEANIKEIMEGKYEVHFKTKYNTELRSISNMLEYWKESYTHKSQRMTRVISSINTHVAVFECLYTINRNFFSDNTKEMLGLDSASWEKISETPRSFENYIELLLKDTEINNGLIEYNNKFLNIVFFKEKDQFYGMIMDKTEDEKLKREIQQELIDKEIEAQTDPLTKLLNRLGMENTIKELLGATSGKGILLMFDLDNFKTINDTLGHPIGDKVIKEFAHCLKSFFNEEVFISRIAGDEFMVFLNEYIEKDILEHILNNLMKKVYEALKEYHIKYKLSTSIGVIYVDKEVDTYEELYKRVDNALYNAKNLGKNTFYIM